MPIFEYRCTKCGNKFEELVTGDRDKQIPCPSCGAKSTEKQMSAIGGISMGKSSSGPSCGSGGCSPASGSSCCSSGMCPHAG
jgi:putative FmdB family regulatory protein